MSQIEYSTTTSPVLSTGNAPKKLHVHFCCMAEALDPKSESISRKRGEIVLPALLQLGILPVTIMVVDTIGAVKSRKLLKILLDSGSTTTIINKRYLPKKCQPCQIS